MDAVLRPEGDVWTVEFGGSLVRLRDAKGLRYLAELLLRPGQEVHVLDLVGAVEGVDASRAPRAAANDLGPLLDDTARAAYKERLTDLAEELDEAERFRDSAKAARAQAEIDLLVDQLTAASGLGGRARVAGSDAERARVAVRRAMKLTLDRINDAQPELGRHLNATVRTGTFCSYVPDPLSPVAWRRAADPGPAPTTPPLSVVADGTVYGRQGERAALGAAWEAARAGEQGLAVVLGEPGIGKTTLAADLAVRAHAAGAVVVSGRCDEGLAVPFQPFVGALRMLLDATPADALTALGPSLSELARILPELAERRPDLRAPTRADPDTERYLLFEAVTALIADVAARSPVLLVLDDLHWAAEPTLFLLRHLLRATRSVPLLVVATVRDTELTPDHPAARMVADVARDVVVTRVRLSGLLENDVAELVTAGGVEAAPGLAGELCRRTHGNPFFVREMVRHLAATGDAGSLPDGVREAIVTRVAALSGVGSRLLATGAVAGSQFTVPLLAAVLDETSTALLDAVDEVVAAGLLLEDATGLAFAHGLVRQAVYESLTATRRAAVHKAVGDALEKRAGSALGDLARHFAEAVPVGDASQAAYYGRLAAEHALDSFAYEDAIAHGERALAVLDSAADSRNETALLLLCGRAAMASGETARGRAWLDRATDLARSAGDGQTLAEIALEAGGRGGEILVFSSEVLDLLVEAARSLDADDPLLACVLARQAVELNAGGWLDEARAVSEQALAAARDCGDAQALLTALRSRHIVLAASEHLAERLSIGMEMLDRAEAAGDSGDQELLLAALASRLRDELERGDMTAVDDYLARVEKLASRLGRPRYQWYATQFRAMRTILAGDLEEAERLAAAALEFGTAADSPNAFMAYGIQLLAIRWEQGRLDEVLPAVLSLIDGDSAIPNWSVGLALIHAEAGRAVEATAALASVGDLRLLAHDVNWMTAIAVAAEVAVAVSDPELIATCAELLAPYAGLNAIVAQGTLALGSIDGLLGALAFARGDLAEAERHLRAAHAFDTTIGLARAVARSQDLLERIAVARH